MFQTCFECGRRGEVLQSHPLPISPLLRDFPLFLRIFPLFLRISPLFSRIFPRFSSLFSSSPKEQGQTTAIYCKNGEFHSDPVCTDPVQNFPIAEQKA